MSTARIRSLLVSSLVCLTLGCADPSGGDDGSEGAPSTLLGEQSAPSTATLEAEDGTGAAEAKPCAIWYRDCDGDGYAASFAGARLSCRAPTGHADCAAYTTRAPAPGAIDCNDQSAAHHPGASYGLRIDGGNEGLQILLCRPDGTYVGGTADRRCVVTDDADLDCDGALDVDPAGGPFCLSGGRCIGVVDHACVDADDCDCVEGTLACGIAAATARLCGNPSYTFTGTVATLCR